jgi:hypothetical protein
VMSVALGSAAAPPASGGVVSAGLNDSNALGAGLESSLRVSIGDRWRVAADATWGVAPGAQTRSGGGELGLSLPLGPVFLAPTIGGGYRQYEFSDPSGVTSSLFSPRCSGPTASAGTPYLNAALTIGNRPTRVGALWEVRLAGWGVPTSERAYAEGTIRCQSLFSGTSRPATIDRDLRGVGISLSVGVGFGSGL